MKILNKNKVLGLFIISLFLVCLIAQPVSAAKTYHDYYWKGSYVQAEESSISYHYLKNSNPVNRWTRELSARNVAIDNKAVYIINTMNTLIALNKTKGHDMWNLELGNSYDKAQFVKKNLVLSSSNKAVIISLDSKSVTWSKSYNMAHVLFYSAIKAKNGSYYLMVKNETKTRFYKLQV